MTEDDVARYLRTNTAFFQQRPEVLFDMQLPDPHAGAAISLAERQAALLRERVRGLEQRLTELIHIGRENDALARNLDEWTKALLACPDRERLEDVALAEMRRVFAVPLVAVRRWSTAEAGADSTAARMVAAMAGPRCGTGLDLKSIPGLGPEWASVRSAAVVPLRRSAEPAAFGLIALGSSDPGRFDESLGTAVLARIGELASAALGSLPDGATR